MSYPVGLLLRTEAPRCDAQRRRFLSPFFLSFSLQTLSPDQMKGCLGTLCLGAVAVGKSIACCNM